MEDIKNKRLQDLRGIASHGQRPILTHLNDDTAWLISVPIPQPSSDPADPSDKKYYHILLDPWIVGTVGKPEFFASLKHVEQCAFSTISDIQEAISVIESGEAKADREYLIDLVVISHHLIDHVGNSLREVDPSTPVLAQVHAAKEVRSLNHFTNLQILPNFDPTSPDWRTTMSDLLPPWLGVARFESPEWFQDLHFAIIITISRVPDEMAEPEAIMYTPHGVYQEDAEKLALAKPPIKFLALLHALNITHFGLKAGLGAHCGLALQRMTGAKYWIRTHDAVHAARGFAYWIVYRWTVTLEEALEKEKLSNPTKELPRPNFSDLPNGGSILLA
ncbi:hypothetical protein PVAG01_08778 [Phlyctema vagabunda]|uniref:Uncharacterized protein n=1 Tax=Phlyctema vagabunda TaxID=108571 RepID=A0ABR4PAD4_9HELO